MAKGGKFDLDGRASSLLGCRACLQLKCEFNYNGLGS